MQQAFVQTFKNHDMFIKSQGLGLHKPPRNLRKNLEQELRRIEDEKKKAEEKILADQQEVIIQTVTTPIADIPVITKTNDNLYDSDFFNRVLDMIKLTKPKNYEPKLSLAPKDNNTMIILLGALGLIGLFVLKKK